METKRGGKRQYRSAKPDNATIAARAIATLRQLFAAAFSGATLL